MKTISALFLVALDYVTDYLKTRREKKELKKQEAESTIGVDGVDCTEFHKEQPRDVKGRFARKNKKNNE